MDIVISTFILEKIVLEAIEKFGEKDFVNCVRWDCLRDYSHSLK